MDDEERGTMIALVQGSLRQTVVALLCLLMECDLGAVEGFTAHASLGYPAATRFIP
jgi:hypothetical protein